MIVGLAGYRHTTRGPIRSRYAAGEIDAFGVYCGELDACFLIPAEAVEGQHAVQLRISAARNGQRAGLHYAADYEFRGAVAQLGERLRGTQEVVGSSPISSTSPVDRTASEAVSAHEFRDRFGWYMQRAAAGATIEVRRWGKPSVRLGPAAADSARAA